MAPFIFGGQLQCLHFLHICLRPATVSPHLYIYGALTLRGSMQSHEYKTNESIAKVKGGSSPCMHGAPLLSTPCACGLH